MGYLGKYADLPLGLYFGKMNLFHRSCGKLKKGFSFMLQSIGRAARLQIHNFKPAVRNCWLTMCIN